MPTATTAFPVSDATIARFWAKVNRQSPADCWLWTGATIRGYGQLMIRAVNRPIYAHRIAWVIANGDIPDNLSVLHRCDVPLCVNPNHLFLGTQADNLLDARRKGRLVLGVSRSRKLTLFDRLEIFFSAERGVDLARRFGVSQMAIHHTRRGRFVGAPCFERVDAGTQAAHDFHQLTEHLGEAWV